MSEDVIEYLLSLGPADAKVLVDNAIEEHNRYGTKMFFTEAMKSHRMIVGHIRQLAREKRGLNIEVLKFVYLPNQHIH